MDLQKADEEEKVGAGEEEKVGADNGHPHELEKGANLEQQAGVARKRDVKSDAKVSDSVDRVFAREPMRSQTK